MHGCAPQPSLLEHADVEVVAALEVAAGVWVDQAAFVATLRRCARSLAAFSVTMRFLEDVGRRRRGGAASSVVRLLRVCSQWFEATGRMDGM